MLKQIIDVNSCSLTLQKVLCMQIEMWIDFSWNVKYSSLGYSFSAERNGPDTEQYTAKAKGKQKFILFDPHFAKISKRC